MAKTLSYFYRTLKPKYTSRFQSYRKFSLERILILSASGNDSIDLVSGLNKNQKAAVVSEKFSVGLCESGPGSGKTRVLTHRIAYLMMHYKVDPFSIMALTFTNKAGNEMKQRLKKLVNEEEARTLTVGTFHSVSNKLLRYYGGMQRNTLSILTGNNAVNTQFTIYDTNDSMRVIKRIVKEYMQIDEDIALAADEIKPNDLLNAILNAKEKKYFTSTNNPSPKTPSKKKSFSSLSRKKNEKGKSKTLTPEEIEFIGDLFLPMYQDIIYNANALDFDDLLLLGYRLLNEVPEVLKAIQRRYKHILVDEYQDTNVIQYQFVKLLHGDQKLSNLSPTKSVELLLLSKDDNHQQQGEMLRKIWASSNQVKVQTPKLEEGRSLFVVGDINQSIYSWRGAVPENMLQLSKDFPHLKTFKLFENYRSSDVIVKVAVTVLGQPNASVAMAPPKINRDSSDIASASPSVPVSIISTDDDVQQAKIATSVIQSLFSSSLRSIAVLYRTNAQSRDIEEVLTAAHIRYKLVGGQRFYDRKEIKDILCYLKLAANPRDRGAAERAINTPPRGIGPVTQDKFFNLVDESNNSDQVNDDDKDENESHENILEVLNRVTTTATETKLKVYTRAESIRLLSPREKKSLQVFADVMNQLIQDSYTLSIEDTIFNLVKALRMNEYVEKSSKTKEEALDRTSNVEELIKAAAAASKSYEGRNFDDDDNFYENNTNNNGKTKSSSSSPPRKLTQQEKFRLFLDDISLLSESVEEDEENEDEQNGVCVVQLMTIHAAKGLEFDAVLLTGCEEGTLPMTRSEEDKFIKPLKTQQQQSSSSASVSCYDDTPAVEEERRLAYVAITRARQVLVMLWRAKCKVFGGSGVFTVEKDPSRFITCLKKLPKSICVSM